MTQAEAEFRFKIDKKTYDEEWEYRQTIDARLCVVILKANGVTKESGEQFDISDFMSSETEDVEIPPEAYDLLLRRMTKAMGGEIINNYSS
jgi:hypothetical protein